MAEGVVTSGRDKEVTPTPQAFWTTFVLIFVAIALLFAFDTFLASIDRSESRAEATALFREGRVLAANGDYVEAIDRFRSAVFTVRGNREYQLALGEALLGAGKHDDAETQLGEILQQEATWGPANLAMARTLVQEHRFQEATSYYHRAIYGQWATDEAANRVKARFELIDLLVSRNARSELLSELLPLLDEAPDSVQLRERLGHLFVLAGSPSRATTIFQEILRQRPNDANAHAGLGEAAFARGNYRTARTAWVSAARLAPGDTVVSSRIALVDSVLALDPTQRGLRMAEQLARSSTLLSLASRQLAACAGPSPAAPVRTVLDTAQAQLDSRVRPSERREAYDANLDLAERIWQLRESSCAAAAAPEDPVALVLARLAQ